MEGFPVLAAAVTAIPARRGPAGSRWKLLVRASDGTEELYDLKQDPGELRNLAAERPEKIAELRAALDAGLLEARGRAAKAGREVLDDPKTLERLRTLGYTE